MRTFNGVHQTGAERVMPTSIERKAGKKNLAHDRVLGFLVAGQDWALRAVSASLPMLRTWTPAAEPILWSLVTLSPYQ
jgi:hypothetical protein